MGYENVEKWLPFYTPFFGSEQQARTFVEPLERLALGDANHPKKIMMHQAQRLVSLADDIPTIRGANETLPLLFLLICAEHLAKMSRSYNGEGQSRAYVRNFFEWYLEPDEKSLLMASIRHLNGGALSLQQVVDALYDIRCDTVHEGKYWGFHFQDGETVMLNSDPDLQIGVALRDFRALVVKGCIRAINAFGAAQP